MDTMIAEIQGEAAMDRPARMAGANRETRLYVVRDLSWELARYLYMESLPANVSAAPDRAAAIERKRG